MFIKETRDWLFFFKWNLIILVILFTVMSNGFAYEDVQILESNQRGLTVQINPVVDVLDTFTVSGENYLRINIRNASQTGEPGEPLIPARIVNIGIPLKAEFQIHVLSSEYSELSGRILPAPSVDRSGKHTYQFNESIYNIADFYPAQLASNDAPAFFRNQRIVSIKINTLQFSARLSKIRIYSKIVLRINFLGDVRAEAETIVPKNKDDNFYRGVVQNYEQSKFWLKQATKNKSLKKRLNENEFYYQIAVSEEGIYKISGSDLTNSGINLSEIDPKTIRIYNNGGRELPREIAEFRPDSLIENSIRVIGEEDGVFGAGDYILFYGKPVNYWEAPEDTTSFVQHYVNHFTNKNIYWLTWGNGKLGKRMQQRAAISNQSLSPKFDFYGRFYNEDEINNFLESGLDWFGRLLSGNQTQNYSAYLPNATNVVNNGMFRIRLLGLTSGTHRFNFYFNGQFFGSYSFSGNQLKTYEKTVSFEFAVNGYNTLKIEYNGYSPESQAYVDCYEIHYRKQFVAENSYLWFAQTEGGQQKYRITNFGSNDIQIYDVTNWSDVNRISDVTGSSGTVTFVDNVPEIARHQYIAVSPEGYRSPVSINSVTLANLRSENSGADYIIIVHDDFYQAVLPLKDQRELKDSLKTTVVKISDIYNEFSWGLFDPTAIRDFIKYAYENWQPQPLYVLLCGDGDYDYKNVKASGDKNWIPPFETTELNENASRTTDDWFVLVSGFDIKPDLAIGRFPVQSAEEVSNVVEKILNYENLPYWTTDSQAIDDWRNVVTMVGDDEYTSESDNEVMHTRDAEYIIEGYVPNSNEKAKIYLIEYKRENDPSTAGFMKPAATEDLISRINRGIIILNYVGHGAPSLWAHERVLKESRDFDRIQNHNKLPLWVAATCDFGRYDDPLEQGLSEKLFAANGRGGIAFISSSRLAYASDNTALNRQFYVQLFNREKPTARLGDALLKAKINNYSLTNDQKYHLFGDPTMRLKVPEVSASISSIEPDTLTALSTIKVQGKLNSKNENLRTFQGKALLKVYDSRKPKIYYTARNSSIQYVSTGKAIFRGTVTVDQGNIAGEFFVPKDISYGGKLGKVSLYFADTKIQGIGYRDSLLVGGTSYLIDNQGPEIKIGFRDQNFNDGGLVPKHAVLKLELSDSTSGINIVGDIGHNIKLTLDDLEREPIILTEYFNYYENNFKAGQALYDFSTHVFSSNFQQSGESSNLGLPEGNHKITIKAWDNFNNSSLVSVYFNVVSDDELVIRDVLNYPNPFSANTSFTFDVSKSCNIKIKIYTLRGTLIQTLEDIIANQGQNQIYWDGRDRDGDELANGVYLYKIIAKADYLQKTLTKEKIGKLVIVK